MEYYNKNELDAFVSNKGKELTEVSETDKDLIKGIHEKSIHLANLIKDKLNAIEVINAPHTINPSRKSSLKSYLWYRIVPNKDWQKLGLALTFTFDDKFWFRVDSDKWDDNSFKRGELLKFREANDIDENLEFHELLDNENYESLTNKIIHFYNQIIEKHKKTITDIATIKVGLLASDSTDWKDFHIEKGKDFNYRCLWNSKRPSGTTNTIKELKETIERFGFFDFYYLEGENAQYKAEIIDITQKDSGLKAWKEQYNLIYGFESKISDFKDDNKNANIVFLARSFQKLENPIHKSKFKLYGNFSHPRQDNLSPFFMNTFMDTTMENTTTQATNSNENVTSKDLGIPKNQILFGPPGTGKTYHTINKALSIIENKLEIDLKNEERIDLKNQFDEYVKSGQIVFTTFHQSMSYEDFVEGIKPQEPENDGEPLIYKVEAGIFKKLCKEAQQTSKQIIVSDENETELTPELFKEYYETYAEKLPSYTDDFSEIKLETYAHNVVFDLFKKVKRNGDYSIIVKSGKDRSNIILAIGELTKVKFEGKKPAHLSYAIPVIDEILRNTNIEDKKINNANKNFILIIDEINRGNVSSIFGELITLLEEDKRLGKEEALKVKLPYSKDDFGVPQNLYIIGTMNTADRSVEALDSALRRRFSFTEMPPEPTLLKKMKYLKNGETKEIDLKKILETINARIEILLDKDHLIGHSYFMQVTDLEGLKKAFAEKIIPLLQEYFYGDYGKIALVLGEGFCEAKGKGKGKAKGKEQEKIESLFAKVDNYDVDSYSDKVIYEIEIFKKDFKIENAIDLLLNKAV